MKSLRFHELLLLAESEKAARSVRFGSDVTVIKAENDRGKSCLIKSLYMALGATPKVVHPRWLKLNVTLHLHFSVDETRYSILKSGRRYSLFDSKNVLIGNYLGVTNGIGPVIAELFDFHLQLPNASTGKPQQATPALLFLPFYFDQDTSWVENWNSFERLKQFAGVRKAIAEFHVGLKPNEYYLAKSDKTNAEIRREGLRHEKHVVNRVLEKLESIIAGNEFDVDVEAYQNEIALLLAKCAELQRDEDRIKEEMVQLEVKRRSLERQVAIAEEAANELGEDFSFASDKLPDDVECPTCGAHYDNSFVERFRIAADEDQLRVALLQMHEEIEACMSEIAEKRILSGEVRTRVNRINEILETRQGEVKLDDILRSKGKREVREVLRGEISALNMMIGAEDGEIEEAVAEMKKYTKPKRVQEIKEYYRERMSLHLSELDVTDLDEGTCKEVDCTIKESGSDKPRALIAFYFAILKTIKKYSTAAFCPVVIDSARQQEQDVKHWRQMLEFMRDSRPADSQMIVGLVDDLSINMGGEVIELFDERKRLQTTQYDAVASRIRPFIDASIAD